MLTQNQAWCLLELAPSWHHPSVEKRFRILRVKNRSKQWRVRVPADLSESGKVERIFFATKLEAEGFVKTQVARLDSQGTAAAVLSASQREIALKAFQRLELNLPEESEAVLLHAVDAFIQSRDRQRKSKTFLEAFSAWQDATLSKTRNGKPTSDKYRRQIQGSLARFTSLHGKLVCDITASDIDSALDQAVGRSHAAARNGLVRVLRACLNWCLRYEWLEKVPVQSARHGADIGQRQPTVLSPAQVGALLRSCAHNDPELLGYFALALFAGIRPCDELALLHWEHVFAGDGDAIHIPESVAKTGRARYVPIEPTLREWLKHINPPKLGPVVPFQSERHPGRPRNLEWRVLWIGKRRRAVQKDSGITPWPQDVMRHSYASYWMTLHRDEDRCRDAMGHATKEMLVKHYRRHTTREDALKFWALTPQEVLRGCDGLEVVA
jgi:integrase